VCLIALASALHRDYPLLLVANRDEYYQRPTRPLTWWSDVPGLLAGRDLQAGGTWLGVTREGRWAAVTNYREGLPPSAPRSRGALTLSFLQGSASPIDFARAIAPEAHLYNGFNLLVGDRQQAVYCSNRGSGNQILKPGIHTLSNHLLDSPWPKSLLASQNLTELLGSALAPEPEALLAVLADRTVFADHLLPSTGVELAWERMLSAPFIVGEDYGTRCTTVLLLHRSGRVRMLEQSFVGGAADGPPADFSFVVAGASAQSDGAP